MLKVMSDNMSCFKNGYYLIEIFCKTDFSPFSHAVPSRRLQKQAALGARSYLINLLTFEQEEEMATRIEKMVPQLTAKNSFATFVSELPASDALARRAYSGSPRVFGQGCEREFCVVTSNTQNRTPRS